MAIVFKVKPWYRESGNPDDYFDPVTHIATEENFIKFLDCGVYDSKYIGYGVLFDNMGLWTIADVNHDSVHTGQTNCYDLVSSGLYNFYSRKWAEDQFTNYYESNIRNYINARYSSFSNDIMPRLMKLKYNSANTWYDTDYIVVPSQKEVGGSAQSGFPSEGIRYPIFEYTDGATSTRVKSYSGNSYWWTRTAQERSSYKWTYRVSDTGSLQTVQSNSSGCYAVGLIRVH